MEASANGHGLELGPLPCRHIVHLRPGLASTRVISSDHEDGLVLPGQRAEVRAEAVSLGHLLPLSPIEHLDGPLGPDGPAASYGVEVTSNGYEAVTISAQVTSASVLLSLSLPAVDHCREGFPLQRPDSQGEAQTVLQRLEKGVAPAEDDLVIVESRCELPPGLGQVGQVGLEHAARPEGLHGDVPGVEQGVHLASDDDDRVCHSFVSCYSSPSTHKFT